MSLEIRPDGLYLDRSGRTVGIVADRGYGQRWRWLTTRGYYVTLEGGACIGRGQECTEDLVADVTPKPAHLHGADSMFGCLP